MALQLVKSDDDDRKRVKLPEEDKARLTFRVGSHTAELSADDIVGRNSWRCCAGKGNTCPTEGTAETIRVAVTSEEVVLVLCSRHAVALHKVAGKAGKRINTQRSLRQFLAGLDHTDCKVGDSPLEDLRQQDARTLRYLQAADDVSGLLDLF